MTDRRAMIDKEELKELLHKVIQDSHPCQFDADDTHDLKELLKIYRETTSTVRKFVIKGILIGSLAIAIIIAAFKFGLVKGH